MSSNTLRSTAPDIAGSAAVGDRSPAETAHMLLDWCEAKGKLRPDRMVVLGLMAGVLIGLGALFFTAVMSEVPLGHGPTRLLGGAAFAMGLLLVCMTGAELSTGNCLLLTAWADRSVGGRAVVRVLWQSYIANAAGALGLAILVAGTGLLAAEHGRVAGRIAEGKAALSLSEAVTRGILCNVLVCFAVWLILAARTLVGKLVGLLLPISAFIAVGLEHSIANLYLLPLGWLAGANVTLLSIGSNVFAVTIGNAIGGAAVALTMWAAHLRREGQALPGLSTGDSDMVATADARGRSQRPSSGSTEVSGIRAPSSSRGA